MLEALRGLGYSTAAALADIIDNSISAGATEVDIEFSWSEALSCIHVLDNGRGMNDAELESAMRLGDRHPLDARAASDLGRFGMGLKTASLSQCRRLTVASKKAGQTNCLRWDLDALEASVDDDWLLYEGPAAGSEALIEPLAAQSSGTLVLWECMDRVVSPGFTMKNFFDLINEVEQQLAMIFHRFLDGESPRLILRINERAIRPWDPFMMYHPAKSWTSPVATYPAEGGAIRIATHVLPHKDRLSPEEYKRAEGPSGWTAQQGFYVYRNERLLVAGGWLGLGQGRAWNKEESYRLARIRLDIPNTADALWRIDIRKSVARPPAALRPWLTQFAEDARRRARHVFAFRAKPATRSTGDGVVEQAWRVERLASGMRYRIDESHSAIQALLEAAGPLAPLARATFRVIEETVPVQRIWLDTAENNETPKTQFADEPPSNVIEVLRVLFEDMIHRKGMSPESARHILGNMEPFHAYPALVDSLGFDDAQEPQ
ncbi:ATP-binding protein [Paraburkholderia sp. Clong3]|uniref:ATP-binding protein n=1 Tax=Paraburkholderia sp. Clong3 TaxID=2991061 RepID=UPI003D21D634